MRRQSIGWIKGRRVGKVRVRKNIGFIKDQAQLRGVVFTDLETKGGQKTNHRGVIVKFDKYEEKDYSNALSKQMNKNGEISKDDYNKYLSNK